VNAIDLLIAVVLVLFALRGLWRGFLREAFGLAGLLAGAVAAATWSRALGDQLAPHVGVKPVVAEILAGAGVFVGAVIVAALLGRLARRVAQAVWLGPVDRGAGVAFGFAKGAALVGLGLMGVQRLAPGSAVAQLAADSRAARPLVQLADRLVEAVRPYTPPTVRQA
jgi:membrane protein required for colicin V production